MKRNLLLPLLLLVAPAWAQAQCSDLFFSEYVEGSSNNKALELYNPTSNVKNLADYQIAVMNNGEGPSEASVTDLGGSIGPKGTFTFFNPQFEGGPRDSLVNMGIAADTGSVTVFNGNDALALINTVSGDTLDVFGIIGDDPGDGWPASNPVTKEQTLVRKQSVQRGTQNWSADQWMVQPQDFFDSLGTHASACGQVVQCQDIIMVKDTMICEGSSFSIMDTTIADSGDYTLSRTISGTSQRDTLKNMAISGFNGPGHSGAPQGWMRYNFDGKDPQAPFLGNWWWSNVFNDASGPPDEHAWSMSWNRLWSANSPDTANTDTTHAVDEWVTIPLGQLPDTANLHTLITGLEAGNEPNDPLPNWGATVHYEVRAFKMNPDTLPKNLATFSDSSMVLLDDTLAWGDANITDQLINLEMFRGDSLWLALRHNTPGGDDTRDALFSFSGLMLVTDSGGCQKTLQLSVSHRKADASFTTEGNTLSAEDTMAQSYQWWKDGTMINGATSETYTATENGEYQLTLTNTCGESDTSEAVTVTVTALASQAQGSEFSLYPNPAEGQIQVALSNWQKGQQNRLLLFDSQGREVFRTRLRGERQQIALPNLESGLYLVEVQQSQKRFSQKLLIR